MQGGQEAAKSPATMDEIDSELRAALRARAERLGLDASSIASPSPGALIARGTDGGLLRLDYRTYRAGELER